MQDALWMKLSPQVFEKLSEGYCLEGRVRDTFFWAASYSEIKSFGDFMHKACEEYWAYQHIMFGKTRDEMVSLEVATNFIVSRYNKFPCNTDNDYAPNGEVTEAGVKQYLAEVLSYDNSPTQYGDDRVATVFKEIDKGINRLGQDVDTREALYGLRLVVANVLERNPARPVASAQTEDARVGARQRWKNAFKQWKDNKDGERRQKMHWQITMVKNLNQGVKRWETTDGAQGMLFRGGETRTPLFVEDIKQAVSPAAWFLRH